MNSLTSNHVFSIEFIGKKLRKSVTDEKTHVVKKTSLETSEETSDVGRLQTLFCSLLSKINVIAGVSHRVCCSSRAR